MSTIVQPALIIGLDLAKHVFQIHGTDQNGEVVRNRPIVTAEISP